MYRSAHAGRSVNARIWARIWRFVIPVTFFIAPLELGNRISRFIGICLGNAGVDPFNVRIERCSEATKVSAPFALPETGVCRRTNHAVRVRATLVLTPSA
jgi:hypothetical protein